MHNKNLFSLLLFPISLFSMDVEPLSDSTFLLWCGALACKEIKREQVADKTPRQFLGIDETNIPTKIFSRAPKMPDAYIAKQETAFVEDSTGVRDRRLGGRWRCLEQVKAGKVTYKGIDWFGRYYKECITRPSDEKTCDEDDNKEEMLLYTNSIPYADEFYLYAGTCAHKDEKLWVTANPVEMVLGSHDKTNFPLRILWVEMFKKPVLLHEFMIPAKTYDIVQKSVAIKFLENGTQFQVYYDDSLKRTESVVTDQWKPSNSATITVRKLVEHCDQPSLWVLTYTLDRMKKYGDKIAPASLARWYDVFQRMQRDTLKEHELNNTKTEVSAAVDQWEGAVGYTG
jgi:hypothetical protein